MKRIIGVGCVIALAICIFSCEDSITYSDARLIRGSSDTTGGNGGPPPPHRILDTLKLQLVFDYWNPTGIDPHIDIDTLASSADISVGNEVLRRPPVIGAPDISFVLEDISINYPPNYSRILDIGTNACFPSEEYIDNEWKSASEFPVCIDDITQLNVALVLDASESLGGDFMLVKQYARQFVDIVKRNRPEASISIVGFSTLIDSHPLKDDWQNILTDIDEIQQGQYTALYGAMYAGISELLQQAADARALVTFTDGNDNYSHPDITPDFLIDRLTETDSLTPPKIRSFTIGFNGRDKVDETLLRELAVNNGQALFTKSMDRLEHLFEDIAKEISRSVHFTYQRNDRPIPESNKRRVRISFDLERQLLP